MKKKMKRTIMYGVSILLAIVVTGCGSSMIVAPGTGHKQFGKTKYKEIRGLNSLYKTNTPQAELVFYSAKNKEIKIVPSSDYSISLKQSTSKFFIKEDYADSLLRHSDHTGIGMTYRPYIAVISRNCYGYKVPKYNCSQDDYNYEMYPIEYSDTPNQYHNRENLFMNKDNLHTIYLDLKPEHIMHSRDVRSVGLYTTAAATDEMPLSAILFPWEYKKWAKANKKGEYAEDSTEHYDNTMKWINSSKKNNDDQSAGALSRQKIDRELREQYNNSNNLR
jgi:hypothetical protein